MITIRKYQPKDRKAVEYIQLDTYLLGKSLKPYLHDTKYIADEIKYYLEKEPESCYVAEDKGRVVGYLLGCLDDKNNNENISAFLGKIIIKFLELPFMHKKDRKWWGGRIRFVLNAITERTDEGWFHPPKNSGHLHINLAPQFRGKGVGSKLLKTYFRYARSKGARLIHADSWGTRLNNNKNFWLKNGFKENFEVRTSFWKDYYPKENITIVSYLKRL